MAEDINQSKEHLSNIQISKTGFDAFVEDVKNSDPEILDDDEICDLIAITRNSDISDEDKIAARNRIYRSQMRTFPFAIHKYGSSYTPFEQLVGGAFETLNACIDAFDLNYTQKSGKPTAKFSTYFIASLRKTLKVPTSSQDPRPAVRVPANSEYYATVMRRAWEELAQRFHREPNSWEWYQATISILNNPDLKRIPKEGFDKIRNHTINHPYLPIGYSRETGNIDPDSLSKRHFNVEELLEDPDSDPTREVNERLMQKTVREAFSTLGLEHQEIIRLRYGLDGGKPLTRGMIGEKLRLTIDRVRQIEDEALHRLKKNRKTREILKDFLED